MITNKPEPRDFERQSIQYLTQALDLIRSKDYEKDGLKHFQVSEEDHWEYHQGILNTSLTLIFLGLENYLKKEICAISPLLLLADEPKRWKTSKVDKKYSSLFIHQFDDLLALHRELGLGEIDEQTATKLDELRIRRNQITHGVSEESITPKYVLETFHNIVLHVWGPINWWSQLKNYVYSEPAVNAPYSEYEKGGVAKYIDLLVSYLGKSKTGEILGISLKQRFYHCPTCLSYEDDNSFGLEPVNYAILRPNKPTSTNLYCVICDTDYAVERKECQNNECEGNVIGPKHEVFEGDDCCLTCCNGNC